MIAHSYSLELVNNKKSSLNEKSVVLFKPLLSKTEKLFRRQLSGALNPLLTRYHIKQEIIYLFGFITWFAIILFMLTIVPIILNKFSNLLFIASFYYWLTLIVNKKRLTSEKLFLILLSNFFSELVNNFLSEKCFVNKFSVNYCLFETDLELTSFVICVTIVGSVLYASGFTLRLGSVILIITQLSRVLSNTCYNKTNTSPLRPFITLIFSLIGIIVARSTQSALSPVISSLISGESRVVAWRRRRSSNALLAVPRRTSLPTLSSGNKTQGCHGNHTSMASVDSAILAEAHGIVTDMLTDSQLPPHILSGLRAVAALLSPPSIASSPRTKPAGISIALVDFNNSESDSEESPYIGERTSNIPKRGKRTLPPSLLRRMSTSTWTTTTSATGMPTLEPEPSRKRSTSFRNLAQSPTNITAPPLHSPVSVPIKGRSYSTTALPMGTFAALQYSRERHEKQLLFSTSVESSFHPKRDQLEERDADNETTEDETNNSVSLQQNLFQQKKFYPRLNLTSDYDSSNDSPSGSDATLDESTSIDTNQRSKSTGFALNEIIPENKTNDKNCEQIQNKCVLCGYQTKANRLTEKSPLVQKSWPFFEPPPPLSPILDNQGRYLVDGLAYDLQDLATDPLLCRINEWDYPIFDLMAKTGDTILSQMSYHVFLEAGLLEAFKIPIPEFLNYFRALEKGYRNKPYHNRTHAADVLQGVYYLTSQPIPGFAQIPTDSTDSPLHKTSIGPLPQSYVKHITVCDETYGIIGANYPALELMALYTAAAMHDFDHPGRTNAFLVATYASQAILYNDRSVLENHHAAAAWSLFLSKPEYNWLRHLDRAEFKRFRFLVIEFILATDLKRHFEILAEFNAKVNDDDSTGIDWFSESDRLLAMEMSIKLADINGPLKKFDIHQQWTYRIAEEFYEQGDEEESLGLQISPFMDRKNPQLAKLQESFINHLVGPLCNAYGEAGLLPGVWEYQDSLSSDDCEQSDEGFKRDSELNIKTDSKQKIRKVSSLHTRHLQENYEFWINILKEKKSLHSMQSSPNISSDDSSTPVITQNTLEEIIEAEENQLSQGSSGTGLS